MLIKHKLKMNEVNNANAGGGGGANNNPGGTGEGTNSSASSGGSGLLTGGGAGSAGSGSNQNAGGTGNAGGAGSSQVVYPENWKLGLPEELQKDPSLSVIADIPSLVKSYINAQKLVGVDKIPKPSQHATPEEWRAVYQKLGLPADKKDYKVEAPKDATLAAEFTAAFAEKAYELGILPHQAQELLGAFDKMNRDAIESGQKSYTAQIQEQLKAVKQEWGAAFDQKLNEARAAVSHFATKEEIAYLEQSGLTNDVNLLKIFSKVGAILKEDGLINEAGASAGAMTPKAAQDALSAIYKNMDHPYYIKEHPKHAEAVAEVTKLNGFAYPPKK